MSIHPLHCQDPWFHYLKENSKVVEGRLNKEAYNEIKVGDQIKFYNENQSFLSTVTKIRHFTTISNYLETVGLQCALPGINTVQEGCEVYLKFYSEEDIKKNGIIAYWVESK